MALSTTVRNAFLDALCRNQSYAVSAVYVQLHTADPGSNGTTAVALESTRKAATFGSAASGGAITNTADIAWTSVAATETYTHISLFNQSTGGTFLGSAALTQAKSVNQYDNFTIPTGDLDLTIT